MKLSLRLPRREVLIIAGAALMAVIITLAVLVGSSRAADRRRGRNAAQAPVTLPAAAPREQPALSLEDFILPDAPQPAPLPRYYPFRPRMERWNPQLVEKFWVPPRQVAIDVLGALNDRNMAELFKDVR
ncbi:MAG TPA: hypothetical protein VMV03_08000 [Spirochaetia bacterium]|nr:hypothetical protein [Spirochaetia bacterium]